MVHLFLQTKKFIPNEFHNSFFEIDFQALYDNGYRLVLSDLDNTLIPYDVKTPTDEIIKKFTEIKEIGFDLILISNNITERIAVFTENIEIKGFANARKPLLSGIKKAFNASDVKEIEKTVIIGDQLMTDIWAANRFNSYSILVNPIKKKTEKWYTRLNRKLEEKMLLKIKNNYPDKWASLDLDKRN